MLTVYSPRSIAQKTLNGSLHIVGSLLFLLSFPFYSLVASYSALNSKQNPNCYFDISVPHLTALVSILKPDTITNHFNIAWTPYVLNPWHSTYLQSLLFKPVHIRSQAENLTTPLRQILLSLLNSRKPQCMQAMVSFFLNCNVTLNLPVSKHLSISKGRRQIALYFDDFQYHPYFSFLSKESISVSSLMILHIFQPQFTYITFYYTKYIL